MRDSATEFSDRQGDFAGAESQILDTVESNSILLHDVLEQVAEIRDVVAAHLHPMAPPSENANGAEADATGQPSSPEEEELYRKLRTRILELEDEVGDLQQQNNDLASQVASQTVQETVQQDDATLSWEERKQLILEQMEQDSFSADQFVASLQQEKQPLAQHDPAGLLDQLKNEMEQHADELAKRDNEISELRHLLDQQSETRNGAVAIGAAALAQAMDGDDFVQEERERLQQLQQEWEEKFRQSEIKMSLERAQLSRERQELATKHDELELQIAQLKREAKYAEPDGSQPSRKWLAKLGLGEG